MSAVFKVVEVYVSALDEAVPLGGNHEKFNVLYLTGQHDDGNDNTANVVLQIVGSEGAYIIQPGETKLIRAPEKSFFRASQFTITGTVLGDGVQGHYTFATWASFNDIELKLEEALTRYISTIAASLGDDTSINPGITDQERLPESISCHVPEAVERIVDTGLWDCTAEIILRSPVDGDGAHIKHRLRTAYVRDLMMDSELCSILSSMVPNFKAGYTFGEARVTNELDPENRKYVARITRGIGCSGSDITVEAEDSEYVGAIGGGWVGGTDGEPIGAL